MNVYLTLDRRKLNGTKRAVLVVRRNGRRKFYPLTKTGCRKAGEDLFRSGTESWMCSSSIDFPQELGFRHDVRELIDEGYQKLFDALERHKASLAKKLLAAFDSSKVSGTLTKDEKKLLEQFRKEVEEAKP